MKLHLTIPLPPSINHAYRYVNGKKIRTKETIAYDAMVQEIAKEAMRKQKLKMFPEKVKIKTDWTYYFPDNRIRDTHNSFKIPLDSMEGIVYRNDYWVLVNILDFIIDKDNPRVEIVVYLK